jgi:hypothetical protein
MRIIVHETGLACQRCKKPLKMSCKISKELLSGIIMRSVVAQRMEDEEKEKGGCLICLNCTKEEDKIIQI